MTLLALRDLCVDQFDGQNWTSILKNVNLEVDRGERLGVVGESGSGKTLTWLAALGLLPPNLRVSGQALLDGAELIGRTEAELAKIRGRRIALIFQDATSALNPVRTIGAQLKESLRLHCGLTGKAAQSRALELLGRVGIADAGGRLAQYPHELSGGLNQRIMIAMALAGEPDLLIADEPTTALDPTVQAQILALLRDVVTNTGMGLVFIAHDLSVVSGIVDQVLVMRHGEIIERAPADLFFDGPRHAYSRALLAASRDLDDPIERYTLQGAAR